jgi:hypothetical protein
MDRDVYDRMQRLLEDQRRILLDLDRRRERLNRLNDVHSPIAAVAGTASVAPIRFCKDCRFAQLQTSPTEEWICSHPTSLSKPKQSLVTGNTPAPYRKSCWLAREWDWDGACGPLGRYWEQR